MFDPTYLHEVNCCYLLQRKTNNANVCWLSVVKPCNNKKYPLPGAMTWSISSREHSSFLRLICDNVIISSNIKQMKMLKVAYKIWSLFSLVMPFGLTNALATFTNLVNRIFKHIGYLCFVFVNDILLYF